MFPPFSGGGSTANAVLPFYELQVAQGYSPGTPLANYQFTSIQSAVDYADANLPTGVVIKIYPGVYAENVTIPSGIWLVGSGTYTSSVVQSVTYTSTEANVPTGLANLFISSTLDVELNHNGTFVMDNVVCAGQSNFTTITLSAKVIIDNVIFTGPVAFHSTATSLSANAIVECNSCWFEANINVGTEAEAMSTVNIFHSTLTKEMLVTVGNGTTESILRLCNCYVEDNASTAKVEIVVAENSKISLMGTPFNQNRISGPGVADMNVIVGTITVEEETGQTFTFVTDLQAMNMNDNNYSIMFTRTGAAATLNGISLVTKTATDFEVITEDTPVTYEVTVVRQNSVI